MEPLKILLSLFAILNPIGIAPIFLTITEHRTDSDRRRMALVAAIGVFVLLAGAVLFGRQALGFFGITVASFRVAGGLLLLLTAISWLHALPSETRQTPEETQAATSDDPTTAAIVPLAMPLLAGPGSISAAIVYSDIYGEWRERAVLVGLSAAMGLIVWVTLALATVIGRKLGPTGLKLTTRLMGLILAAIAVEFIAAGMTALMPGLG